MKSTFFLISLTILFAQNLSAQINNSQYYKDILKDSQSDLVTKKKFEYDKALKLNTYQSETLDKLSEALYQDILKIQQKKKSSRMNNLRVKLEWNYIEHNYLNRIAQSLDKKQQKVFNDLFYSSKSKKNAIKIFRRARLDIACDIHLKHTKIASKF